VEPPIDQLDGVGHSAAGWIVDTVAVIDSGMAYETRRSPTLQGSGTTEGYSTQRSTRRHAVFRGAPLVGGAASGRTVAPHDFVNKTSTPFDFDGHGTHVSGTMAVTNDGIGTAGVASTSS